MTLKANESVKKEYFLGIPRSNATQYFYSIQIASNTNVHYVDHAQWCYPPFKSKR